VATAYVSLSEATMNNEFSDRQQAIEQNSNDVFRVKAA